MLRSLKRRYETNETYSKEGIWEIGNSFYLLEEIKIGVVDSNEDEYDGYYYSHPFFEYLHAVIEFSYRRNGEG